MNARVLGMSMDSPRPFFCSWQSQLSLGADGVDRQLNANIHRDPGDALHNDAPFFDRPASRSNEGVPRIGDLVRSSMTSYGER